MNYGKAIRFARAARAMPQKRLAKLIETDASFISRIEAGDRMPSLETLEAIAKALDIPLYLLTLIASEGSELRGLPPDAAEKLGKELLGIVITAKKEYA